MSTPGGAHWQPGGRKLLPDLLAREWDLLIIGGGITGAGILLEASRRGLKALLVEQRDFAWGTSSRSSKLIHGGLRYLKEGRFRLTRESVHERESLLRDAAGLVEPQSFAFGDYEGRKPGKRSMLFGLAIYDRMAGHSERHYHSRDEFLALAPHVAVEGLRGGICYTDARTDDARLVLRVLQEARQHGGMAVNYLAADALLREEGRVSGASLLDVPGGERHAVRAKLTVNACGAWSGGLLQTAGGKAGRRLRPLRGSHLVLPAWRLPLAQAVSLMHPRDGRPVFAYPWEGAVLAGTTDIDHRAGLNEEAAITQEEVDYLIEALRFQFPSLALGEEDVIATYAGVRPVIDSGQADPSKETRDHALWLEDGLLTVMGGKLTTFRAIAMDALRLARPELPGWTEKLETRPIFAPTEEVRYSAVLPPGQARRIGGRYGPWAQPLIHAAKAGELETVPGTETLWAELRWAARHESVQHLHDLMLRRTRLGILLPQGGKRLLPRVQVICAQELGWDRQRWTAEADAYLALCKSHYSLPAERDTGHHG
ncbi:glycerol-3-phosphate dehydrogenase/oxidase [Massilia endophytica]|uniref:glycerol-3-phosphate dehydrogenase/oxidase n=1 Tax=Massilia endophytica TaxID=2899220 RepID=UPI001E466EBF|nr:glycerol-3-phosphate dehydrogenase/oxidase [Massilia endophytica]UGQ44684.1 glycerol-3-phosphate dehydrogenase/oxidase [Massilia endophytica]